MINSVNYGIYRQNQLTSGKTCNLPGKAKISNISRDKIELTNKASNPKYQVSFGGSIKEIGVCTGLSVLGAAIASHCDPLYCLLFAAIGFGIGLIGKFE